MAGRGTGIPIWFHCPMLRKVYYRTRTSSDYDYHEVKRTGRTKPRRKDGNLGQRTLETSHEYVCRCGYRGWTTHMDIEHKPLVDA